MKKFEDILNHYRPHLEKYISSMSINDLLSPEIWFLQACKWKNHINWPIEFVTECEDDDYVNSFRFEDWDREYHAMRLSILSQEEKIKYLENNIIIDEN